MKRLLVLLALLLPLTAAAQSPCTVKEEMDRIGEAFGVYFVYDASLPVDGNTYFQVNPQKSLQKNLRELFEDSDIVWRVKNQYVVLALNPVELRLAPVWPDPEPAAVMDTLVEAVKTSLLTIWYNDTRMTDTGTIWDFGTVEVEVPIIRMKPVEQPEE